MPPKLDSDDKLIPLKLSFETCRSHEKGYIYREMISARIVSSLWNNVICQQSLVPNVNHVYNIHNRVKCYAMLKDLPKKYKA